MLQPVDMLPSAWRAEGWRETRRGGGLGRYRLGVWCALTTLLVVRLLEVRGSPEAEAAGNVASVCPTHHGRGGVLGRWRGVPRRAAPEEPVLVMP